MKVSLNWLADFVDLSGVDIATLTDALTTTVAEVEGVERHAAHQDTIVVGVIRTTDTHPDADKLTVCQVDVGSETVQIVCGGANVRPDLKVAVALPGSRVRWHGEGEPVELGTAKLRGVESHGMICSAAELELAPDVLGSEPAEKGIVELATDAPAGTKLAEAYPALADTVLDIDNHAITHRADLFSQLGFAREIAVMLRRELKMKNEKYITIDGKLSVSVENPQLCPRYIGVTIANISVQPSPAWIAERLTACGMRPINNIVDASNYVMLELGQPTHAFDATKLKGEKVEVRLARKGEKITTLDGVERALGENMLVIADSEQAIAIAGVMGGANSEVDDATTEIILESATFDAACVRRTATALGLRSEASLRYEKRLDPKLPPKAVTRFLQILRETCPDARILSSGDADTSDATARQITLAVPRACRKLGVTISQDEIIDILTRLEFQILEKGEELLVTVPSFRAQRDIECADDLIEEIARHHGFEKIAPAFPLVSLASPARSPLRDISHTIADRFVGFGFFETCTLGLVSADLLQKTGLNPADALSLVNPPSEDYRFLRTRLITSLLAAARENAKHAASFRLFENASVYAPAEKNETTEHPVSVGLIVGEDDSFAAARGVAESLLADLRFAADFVVATSIDAAMHPGRVAEIRVGDAVVGAVAELHPAVATNFDIPTSAYLYLDLAALAQVARPTVVAQSLPRFPGVPRDIAVLVAEKMFAADIQSAIASADPRIADLELFDEYRGEGVPAGQKSLAFRFEIRDPAKTLADSETEVVMTAITKNLAAIGATLRA